MTFRVSLPSDAAGLITTTADEWREHRLLERLWSKDATVWADPPIPETADRLGWLDAPVSSGALIESIETLHSEAIAEGITDIVLCGMGGSSLAPEVFASTLPTDAGSPGLTVIDSTHPGAVTTVAAATDPTKTWYIVASKSGGTIETISLFRYFWDQASSQLQHPGSHFVAITDPGTSLASLARDRGFRTTVLADPDVGGRYSALTAFGIVPAGLIGVDAPRLLESARHAALVCGRASYLEENPGFGIGVVLAESAQRGNTMVQLIGTPPVKSVGTWIEQLIAESTGKGGTGIVPIDGGPRVSGPSRATIVGIGGEVTQEADIVISLDDPYDIAAVMFVLEFATAVAGRSMHINPFDQPDVQLSKVLAADAMNEGLDAGGARPSAVSDRRWTEALSEAIDGTAPSYISIQAYVPQTAESRALLDEMRHRLAGVSGTYVTVGFGPRFLHSTGQLHKGGPPGGVYLQIVDDTGDTLDVPETGYTFNELITAQAAGDRGALADRSRVVIAVDLGADSDAGLKAMVDQLTR